MTSAPAPTAKTVSAAPWPTTPQPVPGEACTSGGGSPASVVGALPVRQLSHSPTPHSSPRMSCVRLVLFTAVSLHYCFQNRAQAHLASMGSENCLFAAALSSTPPPQLLQDRRWGLALSQDSVITLACSGRASCIPLPGGGLEPWSSWEAEISCGCCHLVFHTCMARWRNE